MESLRAELERSLEAVTERAEALAKGHGRDPGTT
jgi:hypothetical protein